MIDANSSLPKDSANKTGGFLGFSVALPGKSRCGCNASFCIRKAHTTTNACGEDCHLRGVIVSDLYKRMKIDERACQQFTHTHHFNN